MGWLKKNNIFLHLLFNVSTVQVFLFLMQCINNFSFQKIYSLLNGNFLQKYTEDFFKKGNQYLSCRIVKGTGIASGVKLQSKTFCNFFLHCLVGYYFWAKESCSLRKAKALFTQVKTAEIFSMIWRTMIPCEWSE